MKQQRNSYFHSNRGCRRCTPLLVEVDMLQECKLTFQDLPSRLSPHVGTYRSLAREYAISLFRVNDHAAISTVRHGGSPRKHSSRRRRTQDHQWPECGTPSWCPVHLHRRHRLRRVRSRRVSCRSHAGNRSGTVGYFLTKVLNQLI